MFGFCEGLSFLPLVRPKTGHTPPVQRRNGRRCRNHHLNGWTNTTTSRKARHHTSGATTGKKWGKIPRNEHKSGQKAHEGFCSSRHITIRAATSHESCLPKQWRSDPTDKRGGALDSVPLKRCPFLHSDKRIPWQQVQAQSPAGTHPRALLAKAPLWGLAPHQTRPYRHPARPPHLNKHTGFSGHYGCHPQDGAPVIFTTGAMLLTRGGPLRARRLELRHRSYENESLETPCRGWHSAMAMTHLQQ